MGRYLSTLPISILFSSVADANKNENKKGQKEGRKAGLFDQTVSVFVVDT